MGRRRDRRQLELDGLFRIPSPPPPVAGSLDYVVELRHTLSRALKASPLSRHDVAARMSELTGQEISKTQLDAWTAESRTPWRFPFEFAAAFEAACETTCLQELLARKRGSVVLVGKQALDAELGRIERMEEELRAEKRRLKAVMRSVS